MLAFHLAWLSFFMANQETACLKGILAFGLFQTKSCLLDRLDPYLILADLFGVHGGFSQQSQNVNTESV